MILNLLRVEALKIEEMIKRSFGENMTQSLKPMHEVEIAAKQGQLQGLLREPCDICDGDIKTCLKAAMSIQERSTAILMNSLGTPLGRMTFTPGRLVIALPSVKLPFIIILESMTNLQ